MAELVNTVGPLYPDIAGLTSQMQDWTCWAIAARYPQVGAVVEPQLAIDALCRALWDRALAGAAGTGDK